jgi:cytochrome c-type biogenesis protein CcmH/NrfG
VLFERIRRTQKPVFIFLAVMFGLGFVALGVGQGANSIDLGSLFSSGSGSSSGTSISGLQSRVQSHPKDAGAWLLLARAYETGHQTNQAISAFQSYLALKPKNQGALSSTATLLEQRGQSNGAKVQQAQAAAAQYTLGVNATATGSLKLASALTHPLLSSLALPTQTLARTLETSAITDFAQAMGLRQNLVKLAPKNPAYQFLLAKDAYATQSYATVATALEAYLRLSPNLPKASKKQLQQEIAQFKVLAKTSPGGSSTPTTPGG